MRLSFGPACEAAVQNMYTRSSLESTCHCLLAACLLLSQHTQTIKTHVSSLSAASFLSPPIHDPAASTRNDLIRFELAAKRTLGALLSNAAGSSLPGFLFALVAPVGSANFSAFCDGAAGIRRRKHLVAGFYFSVTCIFSHDVSCSYWRSALSR